MKSVKRKRDVIPGFRQLIKQLYFNEKGLIPAIIQDAKSKQALTLCYLNRKALEKCFQDGKVYVYRRSQGRLMLKGETSGHTQKIINISVDCDGKSLIFVIRQKVAACHAGYFSCYYRKISKEGKLKISQRRIFDPKAVYSKK